VNEHEPPRQAVSPLDLAHGHLQEQDAEHARGEEQFAPDLGAVPEEGEPEQEEADPEDGRPSAAPRP
jgi:hypothetical protein